MISKQKTQIGKNKQEILIRHFQAVLGAFPFLARNTSNDRRKFNQSEKQAYIASFESCSHSFLFEYSDALLLGAFSLLVRVHTDFHILHVNIFQIIFPNCNFLSKGNGTECNVISKKSSRINVNY